MWYLCWVSFKLQVHYKKDHYVQYLCNHFFQTPMIYFQEYLKFLMNFIIYDFLVESKPHKKMDLLITASIFTRQKAKKNYSSSNENMLFWRKTDNLETQPLLREPPPPLSTKPPTSNHDPLSLVKFKKQEPP